jgi:hypothetical protein
LIYFIFWAIFMEQVSGMAASNSSLAGTNAFPGYVGPESCRGCHPVEYQRWSQSAHGLAERSFAGR